MKRLARVLPVCLLACTATAESGIVMSEGPLASATDDPCEALASGLAFDIRAPREVAAGSRIDLEVDVRVPSVVSSFNTVDVGLLFSNGHPGARSLFEGLEIKNRPDAPITTSFRYHHDKTTKMSGRYTGRPVLSAELPSGARCIKGLAP